MRKFYKFSKEERVVVLVGIFIVCGVIVAGIVKGTLAKEETYVPKKIDDITTSVPEKKVKVKNDVVKVTLGSELDETTALYIEASEDILKTIELDFTKVKMDKEGTYDVTGAYEDEKINFKIQVVKEDKATAPVISAVNTNFQFVLETDSKVDEIKQYVQAKAVDADGKDISSTITGWPTALPKAEGTQTYKITAKDAAGTTATKDIVVQYLLSAKYKEEINKGQE